MKRALLVLILPAVALGQPTAEAEREATGQAIAAENQRLAPQRVLLVGGTVLDAATIKSRDPASVTFAYDAGIKRVPIQEISIESLKALGISYDPVQAEEFTRQQQAASAAKLAEKRQAVADVACAMALEEAKKRGEYLRVIVKQIGEGGAVCQDYYKGDIFIVGDFSSKVDGERWEGWVWRDGSFKFKTVMGAQRTVQKWNTQPTLSLAENITNESEK